MIAAAGIAVDVAGLGKKRMIVHWTKYSEDGLTLNSDAVGHWKEKQRRKRMRKKLDAGTEKDDLDVCAAVE